jgi:hypothetical protein
MSLLLEDMDTLESELQTCRKHTADHQEQQAEHTRLSKNLSQQIAEYEAALLEHGSDSEEDAIEADVLPVATTPLAPALLDTNDFLPIAMQSKHAKRVHDNDDDKVLLPHKSRSRFTLNRTESEDSD